MKYIITGLHASGKLEVARQLVENGVRVGKIFTNLDSVRYHGELYECLPTEELNRIFENSAHIYFSEVNQSVTNNYECLSTSEYDTNDVFVLSTHQVNSIPMKRLPDDTCFVWMDCNTTNRSSRYKNEHRTYNFKEREELERIDLSDFVEKMYNLPGSRIMYFQNEEPQRVAALVEVAVKFPEAAGIILENFKN